ncbi:LOW QUALITY PROTEIN: uncharacterized Golgi apparatus membrane protein-like protein CG5021 [Lepeophtheirus salmonis]|uniref:LOW QUALITY PROTEIN: uncharacterized Golgi apparatus membrane protein-like protein CG5021 n=1 Tax=Lepeophtheirus salmonis TaxID=72036 RepID=UPI001AE14F3E|nr:LOW QUALITY PROTEIN: uncharacterized Golgi apparatus membrane protein-like protein CG5021 [Lepeophtheirus salmonis]
MEDTDNLIGNEEMEDESYSNITTKSSMIGHRGFQVIEQKQKKPERTLVLFFHGLFKILAFIFYMFGHKVGFTSSFVLVVLLLSGDFWLVKNVSGRLLVGLRWWNFVKDDNSTEWKFESWSAKERQLANKFQMRTFWGFLIIHQSVWSILFMASLFGLHLIWIMIPIVALILNSSNLYGYIRCRWEAKDDDTEEGDSGSRFGFNVSSGLVKNMWYSLKSMVVNPRGIYNAVPLDETVIHQ